MIYFFLLISFLANAASPRKWEMAKGIVERHEFYENDEVISKPQNSWQVLFALTFIDSNFILSKDCVYYRVPGDELGKLKIKSVPFEAECNSQILSAGDVELDQVTNVSLFTEENALKLSFKQNNKNESWTLSTVSDWKKPEPKLLLSSADYKSPPMIYLASGSAVGKKPIGIQDGILCHNIASDCQELSSSTCKNCDHGWVEIPNGCSVGPKVCGVSLCGSKDQPACRRGTQWQRKGETYDCRSDTSFAWCSGNLTIVCDGDKAYCR